MSRPVKGILLLKYLKKVNLAANKIECLWDLPNSVEQLCVCDNLIANLEPVLPRLAKLESLNVARNRLSSLKPLGTLSRIKSLNASFNKIESLEGLENCKDLQDLNLESNQILHLTSFICESALCLFNIKTNPILSTVPSKSTELLEKLGFFPEEEGVFYRCSTEKNRKTKLSLRKQSKEDPKSQVPSFRSRNISMQEIYDQVINEDPEMEESFNQSESEENLIPSEELNKKTIQVSKLQLEKILDKPADKISAEKWSTKPDSIEVLLEDFIQFCGLNDYLGKGLSSCEKYESLFKVLKQREEERKNCAEAYDKILESSAEFKRVTQGLENLLADKEKLIESLKSENFRLESEVSVLKKQTLQLSSNLQDLKIEFEKIEEKLCQRIRTLEDERNSARLNFSCSYESEVNQSADYQDLDMKNFVNNNQVLVPVEVAEYISKLLSKISSLVTKNKKLRVQIEKYKCLINTSSRK